MTGHGTEHGIVYGIRRRPDGTVPPGAAANLRRKAADAFAARTLIVWNPGAPEGVPWLVVEAREEAAPKYRRTPED